MTSSLVGSEMCIRDSLHVPLHGGGLQKTTAEETESLEQHYKQGHIPKRKDCPVCQQTSGPVVRDHL
eukprot:2914398-Prorocentrum_lima.AAC.1